MEALVRITPNSLKVNKLDYKSRHLITSKTSCNLTGRKKNQKILKKCWILFGTTKCCSYICTTKQTNYGNTQYDIIRDWVRSYGCKIFTSFIAKT